MDSARRNRVLDPAEWVEYSDRDMEAARVLHDARHSAPVVFFLQQAIEKRLKALLVAQTGVEPPRVHNLLHLAEMLDLELGQATEQLLFDLSHLYITTRYPGFQLPEDMFHDPEQMDDLFRRTEEVLAWLDQLLKRTLSQNEP